MSAELRARTRCCTDSWVGNAAHAVCPCASHDIIPPPRHRSNCLCRRPNSGNRPRKEPWKLYICGNSCFWIFKIRVTVDIARPSQQAFSSQKATCTCFREHAYNAVQKDKTTHGLKKSLGSRRIKSKL